MVTKSNTKWDVKKNYRKRTKSKGKRRTLKHSQASAKMVQSTESSDHNFALFNSNVLNDPCLSFLLPGGELEKVLQIYIDECNKGINNGETECSKSSFRGLTAVFSKILTSEDVKKWEGRFQKYIKQHCSKLVELCVLKLNEDCLPILDLLAMLLNPHNSFFEFNKSALPSPFKLPFAEDQIYAKPMGGFSISPNGWIVDLLNEFGGHNGFRRLLKRFQDRSGLTLDIIDSLMKPFHQCCEFLTIEIIIKYFKPIVEIILKIIGDLSDAELDAVNNTNSTISSIMMAARALINRVPSISTIFNELDIFIELKLVDKLLNNNLNFNAKKDALVRLNRIVDKVNEQFNQEDVGNLFVVKVSAILKWMKEHKLLEIFIANIVEEETYVGQIEKLLSFMLSQRFTIEDLDIIWKAADDKNKNFITIVHNLLEMLFPHFTPELADHLLELVQSDLNDSNSEQRVKLLTEYIQYLHLNNRERVNDYKTKVLGVIWDVVHREDIPTLTLKKILAGHVKLLSYSPSTDEEDEKMIWLKKWLEKLNDAKWFLTASSQIRKICCLYPVRPISSDDENITTGMVYRGDASGFLENEHNILTQMCNNLKEYRDTVKKLVEEDPNFDVYAYRPDNRYPHQLQIKKRLKFTKFVLGDQYYLSVSHARRFWNYLIEDPACLSDREIGFKWFSDLLKNEESQLDPLGMRIIYEELVLKMSPALLTQAGFECSEMFFRTMKKGKERPSLEVLERLQAKRKEFLWKVVKNSQQKVADSAVASIQQEHSNIVIDLQAISKLLDCPVCYAKVVAPVESCPNGHVICKKCKHLLPALKIGQVPCPVCRETFKQQKNVILDQLLELIPVPCVNSNSGCNESMPISMMEKHEATCDYRCVSCVCKKNDLVVCELDKHFQEHKDVAKNIEFLTWYSVHISKTAGNHVYRIYYVRSVQLYFLLRCIVDWDKQMCYFCISCIGKRRYSEDYIYEIKLEQNPEHFKDCYTIFNGVCLPYIEKVEQIRNHSKVISLQMEKVFLVKDMSEFDLHLSIKPIKSVMKKRKLDA